MAKKLEFSKKLQQFMDELPISDHPLYRIIELCRDPTLPASLRVELLLGAARFFSPVYASTVNKNEISGSLEHKQMSATSVDIVAALASCDEATRRKILTGAGVLQLESGNSNDS